MALRSWKSWGLGRPLLPGEAAGADLREDVEPDEAFQLGAGLLDVLRQQFVAEGFADITGPSGPVTSLKAARMRG